MYEAFFGLQRAPFSIAPDPRSLFLSEVHREALAHLIYGLEGGGGFVVLTGEIGSGKTTLCRCVMEQVPEACQLAYLFNPQLSAPELLRALCEEFGIALPQGEVSVKASIDALNGFLLASHGAGRHSVLIVDEAQSLSASALEQLRLLTNLETSERKLLQIVLVGQPELRTLLAAPMLESLTQRVTARYHLGALSAAETVGYVAHRVAAAGRHGPPLFADKALREIHRLSRGLPRRINLLCDRALLGAYAAGAAQVSRGIVLRAAREIFDVLPQPTPGRLRRAPGGVFGAAVVVLVAAVLAVVISGVAWRSPAPSSLEVVASAKATAPRSALISASPTPSRAAPAPTIPPPSVPWSELRVADAVAWQGLSARWGLSASAVLAPCPSEADTGLLCYRSMNGNLGQIRELDRPTALRLRPPGGAPQWMLLLALDNQSATLQLSGRNVRLPLSQLAEAWRGEFLLWWRAPALGQRGEQRAAGLRNETEVRAFQVAHGLQPDGRAGPLTGMLFNRFAGVEEPHLTASP